MSSLQRQMTPASVRSLHKALPPFLLTPTSPLTSPLSLKNEELRSLATLAFVSAYLTSVAGDTELRKLSSLEAKEGLELAPGS